MKLHGKNIIANQLSGKGASSFSASNPSSGEQLEPLFINATSEEIDTAFEKADEAFETLQEVTRSRKADFWIKLAMRS